MKGFTILRICIFAFMFVVTPIFGVSVEDYAKRIESTRTDVAALLESVAEAEARGIDTYDESAITSRIRTKLLSNEKIEWNGGAIETSNQWLADAFGEFEREHDLTRRGVILTEISERLASISQKIGELEKAAASDRSKDEDKRKLAEILGREEYQKPTEKQQSLAEKWLLAFLEWLESWMPKFNPGATSVGGLGSLATVLQVLLFVLIAGLIGFGIYKLAPIFAPRFRRKAKSKKSDRVILGERIAEHESAADLFGEAEQMARDGNVRGAIRKGYIALLCELSDRRVVGLAQHKTNRDYLRDIRSRKELYQNMTGLTGSFERHWYGSKSAENSDWSKFREDYQHTVRSI